MSSVNILNMIPKITALPLHRTNTYDNSMAGVTQPASQPAGQPASHATHEIAKNSVISQPSIPTHTLQLFDSTLFQLFYIWTMIYTIFLEIPMQFCVWCVAFTYKNV